VRSSSGLFTDQYELTMAQAYLAEGMAKAATFSLFVRVMPQQRSYLLAAGLDDVLRWLETVRFGKDDIEYLRSLGVFSEALLRWLATMRFTGDVRAMPEGTPFFCEEPILEIDAPIAEAQLVETSVINRIHAQTVLASKAARVVEAAAGKPILDFSLRRTHGGEGGVAAARAFHIAGIAATSNMAAGAAYGVPVAGTMAHSFVESFPSELESFRAFVRQFPRTVLLVDTYDTLRGVRHVVELARELGPEFHVHGVRLDSGDLGELATAARGILDDAGLRAVQIFASGGLDEWAIQRLASERRPIDGFGVGTSMGVSEDAPKLDMAYKLVEYAGRSRMKLSAKKRSLPGKKQVFRIEEDGRCARDVIGRHGEEHEGRPLLVPVMKNGKRTEAGRDTIENARMRAREEIDRLPPALRALERCEPFPVELSAAMRRHLAEVEQALRENA
jgi:nicotinate phosphoribosyltransferase